MITRHGRERLSTRTPVPAETIASGKIEIERKQFIFSLQENARGQFLRITEDAKGRRNSIVIPAPGLAEFKRLLDAMQEAPPEKVEEQGSRNGAR